jgi:F420-dependent oxidoreductase-like protein
MQNQDTSVEVPAPQTARERVGLVVSGAEAAAAVAAIVEAEAVGVYQIWMTQSTPLPDTLGIFAAAGAQTSRVLMGTAVVPTFPRNPLALAQQVLTVSDLAPGRLRLGIGPSHRPVMEGVYGVPLTAPLEHLREYVSILRALLWEGEVDHHGRFFNIHTKLPRMPHTPILISALRENAYRLAGEISDGAISWVCPVPYLVERALPAMREGAAHSGRPVPPLIAHIPVALSQDRPAVLAAARLRLSMYGKLPFYAAMFANAGFPVSSDGAMSDELFDSLVISGDDDTIRARLADVLATGLDELLVMPIAVSDATAEQTRLAKLIGQLQG